MKIGCFSPWNFCNPRKLLRSIHSCFSLKKNYIFFFYPKCRAYKITEVPSAKHKLQRNPIKSVLHTLSCLLYLNIPHKSISFMMEQLKRNLQEPRNSLGGWFPLRLCLSSPRQQHWSEMLSKPAQSINPCGCYLKAAQETDPDYFTWNSCVLLPATLPFAPSLSQASSPWQEHWPRLDTPRSWLSAAFLTFF